MHCPLDLGTIGPLITCAWAIDRASSAYAAAAKNELSPLPAEPKNRLRFPQWNKSSCAGHLGPSSVHYFPSGILATTSMNSPSPSQQGNNPTLSKCQTGACDPEQPRGITGWCGAQTACWKMINCSQAVAEYVLHGAEVFLNLVVCSPEIMD